MATTQPTLYHTNNASIGLGGTIPGVQQNIHEESATQKAPLGRVMEFDDGRRFRYTKAGAAIAIGLICGNDQSLGSVGEEDTMTVTATAGNSEITLTDSAFITGAGAYNGSFLMFTDGPGAGESYRIKSHTAAASNVITFQLYDKLKTTPVSATGYCIVSSPYDQVLAATSHASPDATTDTWAVGAAPIAVQSGYYFWMQTKGVAAVLGDLSGGSAPYYGQELVVSNQHAGQVEGLTASLFGAPVGVCLLANEDDEHWAVYLSLE